MPAQPAKGVFVNKDSYYSRQLRLQAGDIIVGLDGWRVESLEQYHAIMAFAEDGAKHKISAWRGVLFTIEAYEHLGMELATYPLKGWIQ
jgi:S1-C subfamily serine protease